MIEFLVCLTHFWPNRSLPCGTNEPPVTTLTLPGDIKPALGESVGAVQLTRREAHALADLYETRQSGVVPCRDGELQAEYEAPYIHQSWDEDDAPARMRLSFCPREGSAIRTQSRREGFPEVMDLGANLHVIACALRGARRLSNSDVSVQASGNHLYLNAGGMTLSLTVPRAYARESLVTWLAQALVEVRDHPYQAPGLLRAGCGVTKLPHGPGRALAFASAVTCAFDWDSRTMKEVPVPGPVVIRPGDLDLLFLVMLKRDPLRAYLCVTASTEPECPEDPAELPEWLADLGPAKVPEPELDPDDMHADAPF